MGCQTEDCPGHCLPHDCATVPDSRGQPEVCRAQLPVPMRILSLLNCSTFIAAMFFGGLCVRAEEADDLIKKGDYYYDKLQASDALKYYLPAAKMEPK